VNIENGRTFFEVPDTQGQIGRVVNPRPYWCSLQRIGMLPSAHEILLLTMTRVRSSI
jgi:hypothetical protein